MSWLGAVLVVIVFAACLKWLRVIVASQEAIALARIVTTVLKDKALTDLEKERAMQRYSVQLFKYFFIIVVGCAAALAIPFAIIWGAEQLGLMSVNDVLAVTLSWPFLTLTTLLAIVVYAIVKRRR